MAITFYRPVLGGFHLICVFFFILDFLSEKGQKIFLTCFQYKVFLFGKNFSGFLREKYDDNIGNLRDWERFPQDSSLSWFILNLLEYLAPRGRSYQLGNIGI